MGSSDTGSAGVPGTFSPFDPVIVDGESKSAARASLDRLINQLGCAPDFRFEFTTEHDIIAGDTRATGPTADAALEAARKRIDQGLNRSDEFARAYIESETIDFSTSARSLVVTASNRDVRTLVGDDHPFRSHPQVRATGDVGAYRAMAHALGQAFSQWSDVPVELANLAQTTVLREGGGDAGGILWFIRWPWKVRVDFPACVRAVVRTRGFAQLRAKPFPCTQNGWVRVLKAMQFAQPTSPQACGTGQAETTTQSGSDATNDWSYELHRDPSALAAQMLAAKPTPDPKVISWGFHNPSQNNYVEVRRVGESEWSRDHTAHWTDAW